MRVAFITNICPHYRVRTYEILATKGDVEFLFFSAGGEWFWQEAHGVQAGDFPHQYIGGFSVLGTRLTPSLPWKLWRGGYDVYIKDITGRFALPVTYLIARLRRRPIILWTGVWMRLQSRFHRWMYPITRYIYRHVDAVVVYGEHVKRFLVAEGVAADRIFVAPHAMDNASYAHTVEPAELNALRTKLDLASSAKVILYLGRVVEEKGIDYLLRALAQVDDPDAVCVIAGDGAARPSLEALAEELGLGVRVRFVGYVAREHTPAYYSLGHVHVLPSITTAMQKEPWGLTINEGFNQGLPVIATDAVGAAMGGLVEDGVNGYIVTERDAEALAAALRRVLADDALRTRLSDGARDTIASWDNERMVQGFVRAIEAVTSC